MATAKELMLDQQAWYGGEFIMRIKAWLYFLRGTKGCKWPGRADRGGHRKGGTIIEVGLALELWNQDLGNGWGQSARGKIECNAR